ncbi:MULTISPECIES: hypothetical protein [Haloferax]|uniref:hypothetical protein n=1 Tax=Haloferax TaxID=2251 RepID=UPI00178455FA|nr:MULTISPECIES: hypothetical protein [Haloferax]
MTDDERTSRVRQTLVDSLRERGHIYTTRVANAVVTTEDGRIERTNYGGVRFVPLVGSHGFAEEE